MPSDRHQNSPFRRRVGHDIERFRGVNTEQDAGAIGMEQSVTLENVRFRGGRLANRSGLSKVNSGGAMSGCIHGFYGDGDGGGNVPVRIYIVMNSSTGDGVFTVWGYDSAQNDTFQIPNLASGTSTTCFFWNGRLYVGVLRSSDYVGLYEVVPPPSAAGQDIGSVATAPRLIWESSGSGTGNANTSILGYCALDDKLYFSYWDSSFDLNVKTWDGKTIGDEVTVAASLGNGMYGPLVVFREEVHAIVGGDNAATEWRVRSHAGVWSSITIDSEPSSASGNYISGAAVYKNTLYSLIVNTEFTGVTTTGWMYQYTSGGTATVATSWTGLADGDATPYGGLGLVEFNGYLFFSWVRESDGDCIIGRYDGSSWVTEHKNLTDQGIITSTHAAALCVFNGALHCVFRNASATGFRIYKAPEDTTGTWTLVVTEETVGIGTLGFGGIAVG
jgi:hypothetical protein